MAEIIINKDRLQHITPYEETGPSKKQQVELMFDNIAHRYDFLNHLLSLGIDKRWRKTAVQFLSSYQPKHVLDMATGTGDFAFDIVKGLNVETVVGLDLSNNMLEKGRKKATDENINNISFIQGDAEKMNFESDSFDAITAGFGVRNFEHLEKGLAEMYRVLKPGAPLVILEISKPDSFPIKQLFGIYFHVILPVVGRLFSKDHRAYTYLPESVLAFPKGKKFTEILEKTGFKHAKWQSLTFGICTMYTCEK